MSEQHDKQFVQEAENHTRPNKAVSETRALSRQSRDRVKTSLLALTFAVHLSGVSELVSLRHE
jgi:hypothetical protein